MRPPAATLPQLVSRTWIRNQTMMMTAGRTEPSCECWREPARYAAHRQEMTTAFAIAAAVLQGELARVQVQWVLEDAMHQMVVVEWFASWVDICKDVAPAIDQ